MKVYIIAPYSLYGRDKDQRPSEVRKALEMARQIVHRGDTALVPHAALYQWPNLTKEEAKDYSFGLLLEAEAIAIADGPDTERTRDERRFANHMGKRIYDLTVQPQSDPLSTVLSGDGLVIRLKEYELAANAYDHTYATIWQAGSALIAISAALVAFLAQKDSVRTWMLGIGAFPFFVWYFGIFLPMDFYGRRYRARAKEIETSLSFGRDAFYVYLFRDIRRKLKEEKNDTEPAGFSFHRPRVREAMKYTVLIVSVLAVLIAIGDWSSVLPDHIAKSASDGSPTQTPSP